MSARAQELCSDSHTSYFFKAVLWKLSSTIVHSTKLHSTLIFVKGWVSGSSTQSINNLWAKYIEWTNKAKNTAWSSDSFLKSDFFTLPKARKSYSHITIMYNRLGNFTSNFTCSPTCRVFQSIYRELLLSWELPLLKAEENQLIILKQLKTILTKIIPVRFISKLKCHNEVVLKWLIFEVPSIITLAFASTFAFLFFRKYVSLSPCHKKCFCPAFLITSQNIFSFLN